MHLEAHVWQSKCSPNFWLADLLGGAYAPRDTCHLCGVQLIMPEC